MDRGFAPPPSAHPHHHQLGLVAGDTAAAATMISDFSDADIIAPAVNDK